MSKHAITIVIDTDYLSSKTDAYVAECWHVAQANPAPFDDREAGDLAETIGREIIRRWLEKAPAELWHHQGRSYYSSTLQKNGSWPGPKHDVWVYEAGKAEGESELGQAAAPAEGKSC